MTPRRSIDELGPLFTITEDELSRPARRREDRDVLVLRVEIEASARLDVDLRTAEVQP